MDVRTVLAAIVGLALLGIGCGKKPPLVAPVEIIKTIEVLSPVATPVLAPPELLAPYKPATLPVFIQPSDPNASSALDTNGERALRAMFNDLMTIIGAWQAWYAAQWK